MNWLDLAIIAIVFIGLIKGLFDGFIKQVVSLISLILAIFFAGKAARPLRDYLISQDSITDIVSPQIIAIICYIFAFIFILAVCKWLAELLDNVMLSPVSFINHITGGILGCLLSLLCLSLLFNILTVFDSDSKIIKEQTKNESVLYYKVESITPLISPFIKTYIHYK